MNRTDDVVSAPEIAAWAWCPESWRLDALGHEPGNRAALKRGERRHHRTARFERWSVLAIKVGAWLVVVSLLLAALAFVLYLLATGACLGAGLVAVVLSFVGRRTG